MNNSKLTTAQAAEILQCCQSAIQKYIATGLLAAEKPGRDWLIKEKDLASFVVPTKGRPRIVRICPHCKKKI